MPKLLPRIALFITTLILLFGLFLLPTTADKTNISSVSNDNISSFDVAPLISAQVTFTPVTTIYLPVVFASLQPSEDLEVSLQLPDGQIYNVGDEVRVIITASSLSGVESFVWGVFTQNLVGLRGGEVDCSGITICRREITFDLPIPGTFIIGVEALEVGGNTQIDVTEIYVTE